MGETIFWSILFIIAVALLGYILYVFGKNQREIMRDPEKRKELYDSLARRTEEENKYYNEWGDINEQSKK